MGNVMYWRFLFYFFNQLIILSTVLNSALIRVQHAWTNLCYYSILNSVIFFKIARRFFWSYQILETWNLDIETCINIIFIRGNVSLLLFEKYQHEPKVAVTVTEKITVFNLIELYIETGTNFNEKKHYFC